MTLSAGIARETYRDILQTARRFAPSEADARDLVQDVLEIALARGVEDWSSPERRAWLRGAVRRRAAFVARGQHRRRRRELSAEGVESGDVGAWKWQPSFLNTLPRSLRIVAMLASADLSAAEIRWLLQLSDTALRQRLSALRRALRAHGGDEPPISPASRPPGGFGPQRAQLLGLLRGRGGRAVATHDPDGHVLFLRITPHERAASGNH